MTDNKEKKECFMCRRLADCVWDTDADVWLCDPCKDDLVSIRAEVVGV